MKATIISIIISLLLIFGAVFLSRNSGGTGNNTNLEQQNNVTIQNGTQIVELTARGGYSPRKSVAKAGVPTILRVTTNGTFDCSASIRIPSMNLSKILQSSSSTDIDIGSQPVGVFRGTCGMGMYPFEITFN
ncbi:MAG: cupredoxin domain-containing protein [bacterium]